MVYVISVSSFPPFSFLTDSPRYSPCFTSRNVGGAVSGLKFTREQRFCGTFRWESGTAGAKHSAGEPSVTRRKLQT